jgi:tRNA threonylcarbamoyladenosine biosynthesis protein TsaE
MSTFEPLTHHQTWQTPHQTQSLGKRLGEGAVAGQIIALRGDLGAGKTTLTQGIAVGLGISARVTSPTFILINEYDAGSRGLRLIHIDTYRLGDTTITAQMEAETLGLEEIFTTAGETRAHAGAVVVVEWAERVAALLPPDHLYITLTTPADDLEAASLTATGDATDNIANVRHAHLCAFGPQSAALLAQIMD